MLNFCNTRITPDYHESLVHVLYLLLLKVLLHQYSVSPIVRTKRVLTAAPSIRWRLLFRRRTEAPDFFRALCMRVQGVPLIMPGLRPALAVIDLCILCHALGRGSFTAARRPWQYRKGRKERGGRPHPENDLCHKDGRTRRKRPNCIFPIIHSWAGGEGRANCELFTRRTLTTRRSLCGFAFSFSFTFTATPNDATLEAPGVNTPIDGWLPTSCLCWGCADVCWLVGCGKSSKCNHQFGSLGLIDEKTYWNSNWV